MRSSPWLRNGGKGYSIGLEKETLFSLENDGTQCNSIVTKFVKNLRRSLLRLRNSRLVLLSKVGSTAEAEGSAD